VTLLSQVNDILCCITADIAICNYAVNSASKSAELIRTELNYHQYDLHLHYLKRTLVYQYKNTVFAGHKLFCLIIIFHSIPSIPSIALQPILGPAPPPPQKEDAAIPHYFPLVSSILVFLGSALFHLERYLVFGFPIVFFRQSKILHDMLSLNWHPSDGVLFKTIVCQDMNK
jgi:hypothetical protein